MEEKTSVLRPIQVRWNRFRFIRIPSSDSLAFDDHLIKFNFLTRQVLINRDYFAYELNKDPRSVIIVDRLPEGGEVIGIIDPVLDGTGSKKVSQFECGIVHTKEYEISIKTSSWGSNDLIAKSVNTNKIFDFRIDWGGLSIKSLVRSKLLHHNHDGTLLLYYKPCMEDILYIVGPIYFFHFGRGCMM